MRGSGQDGAAYRLVVHLAGGTTQTTPTLRNQKRAIADIAPTVRRAAHAGALVAVVLQRQSHDRVDAADDWEPVEQWGPNVLTRIVEQSTPSGCVPAPPQGAPTVEPAPLAAPDRRASAHLRRTHRWQVALVLTAAALTWLAAVLYLTDGQPFVPRASRAAPVVTTLPLEAPTTRPAPARAATPGSPTRTVVRPGSGPGDNTSDKNPPSSAGLQRPAWNGE